MSLAAVSPGSRTWGVAILLLAIALVAVTIALASAGTIIAGITYTGAG